jgi:hypothetical protein
MTYTYAWVDLDENCLHRRDSDNNLLIIPVCDGNRHYQEYLEWLAEGNTPEPADPNPEES